LCVFLLGKTIDEFDNKFSFNIPLNLCTWTWAWNV
jgi:hypothetical protein